MFERTVTYKMLTNVDILRVEASESKKWLSFLISELKNSHSIFTTRFQRATSGTFCPKTSCLGEDNIL